MVNAVEPSSANFSAAGLSCAAEAARQTFRLRTSNSANSTAPSKHPNSFFMKSSLIIWDQVGGGVFPVLSRERRPGADLRVISGCMPETLARVSAFVDYKSVLLKLYRVSDNRSERIPDHSFALLSSLIDPATGSSGLLPVVLRS